MQPGEASIFRVFHIFVEWKWLKINEIISHGYTVNSFPDTEGAQNFKNSLF